MAGEGGQSALRLGPSADGLEPVGTSGGASGRARPVPRDIQPRSVGDTPDRAVAGEACCRVSRAGPAGPRAEAGGPGFGAGGALTSGMGLEGADVVDGGH